MLNNIGLPGLILILGTGPLGAVPTALLGAFTAAALLTGMN